MNRVSKLRVSKGLRVNRVSKGLREKRVIHMVKLDRHTKGVLCILTLA